MRCNLRNLFLGGMLTASLAFHGALSAVEAAPPPASATQNNNAAAPKDAVTFYSAGLEGILVDPKDKGLVSALRLLDERILELPNELKQPQIPAPAFQLVLEMLMDPMSLRAGAILDADPQKGPPFYAQWSFYPGDQQKTDALAGRFSGMFAAMAPMPTQPAPNMPGMTMLNMNGVPLYFGSMKAGGEPSFTIALNKADSAPLKLGQMDLPEGVHPALAFNMDARQFQPFMDMAMAQAGPGADMAKQQLQGMGMYGPNALAISAAIGYSQDRGHLAMRYLNYRKIAEQSKMLATQRISADDLRRVPADATCAKISKFNISRILEGMKAMMARVGNGPDPMAMIEQQTGINPQRDILDYLGQTAGMYMSDSTGGGGLLSSVMFVEVTNPEALNQSITRISAMFNQIAQQNAKGYARIGSRTVNKQAMTVLSFPGLPVPLEISCAIVDKYLYAAASPQALLSAINQGHGGKSSLLDNPRFKEAGGDKIADAIQVSFVDTPRLIRDGYGMVSLGMAALANAVRSPVDANRDPGLVMPSYGELASNARAALTIARIQGDDLVMTGQFDRSWLVNACGSVGMIGGSTGAIATAALAAGVMMPALGKAREAAKMTKSMVQLRSVGQAYQIYANANNDTFPKDTQDLIAQRYITRELLDSPEGDAPDGQDYWFDTSGLKLSAVQDSTHRVMGYDRAMLSTGKNVNVLFYDGHVETMPSSAFRQLILKQPNAGVNFKLPD